MIILSLVLGLISFRVLRPFMSPLAWATVLSIVFYPLYVFIKRYLTWRSSAAVATLIIILVIILGPFSYVSFLLVSEVKDMVGYIDRGELDKIKVVLEHPRAEWLVERATAVLGVQSEDLGDILVQNISSIGNQLIKQVTSGAKNALVVIMNFIIMSVSIFFLLRDGPRFISRVYSYLPFSDEQKERLERQIKGIVVSTLYGGVVVALVQGTIGATAFYFLGIKSPMIWGSAIFVMSFIPVLGTFSIWGPAVVYQFMVGNTGTGFALAIIGTFGISMVDNILKPLIISGRTKMPTLLIIFSVLGGIKLFGLVGLIAGPLVLAMFITVLDVFISVEGGSSAEQEGS